MIQSEFSIRMQLYNLLLPLLPFSLILTRYLLVLFNFLVKKIRYEKNKQMVAWVDWILPKRRVFDRSLYYPFFFHKYTNNCYAVSTNCLTPNPPPLQDFCVRGSEALHLLICCHLALLNPLTTTAFSLSRKLLILISVGKKLSRR